MLAPWHFVVIVAAFISKLVHLHLLLGMSCALALGKKTSPLFLVFYGLSMNIQQLWNNWPVDQSLLTSTWPSQLVNSEICAWFSRDKYASLCDIYLTNNQHVWKKLLSRCFHTNSNFTFRSQFFSLLWHILPPWELHSIEHHHSLGRKVLVDTSITVKSTHAEWINYLLSWQFLRQCKIKPTKKKAKYKIPNRTTVSVEMLK